jgi:predicted small metal-binding protein
VPVPASLPVALSMARRTSWRKEHKVRALDCDCGQQLEAADDEKLFENAREHVDQAHPERELSDQQIRNLIAERGYNPDLFRE